MLIGRFPTTLLQIFCEIILNSQVIVKSRQHFQEEPLVFNGLTTSMEGEAT